MIVMIPLLQVAAEAAAEPIGMNPVAWTFMLISMGGVTILAVWSFARILGNKEHFDPDGTGPASPPVPGRYDAT